MPPSRTNPTQKVRVVVEQHARPRLIIIINKSDQLSYHLVCRWFLELEGFKQLSIKLNTCSKQKKICSALMEY